MVSGPSGLGISATGLVTWTPSAAGSFPVTIRAANAGGSADQPYTITVAAATPPTINSSAVTTAAVGQAYSYQATATGTAPITWSVVSGPSGLGISTTGLVTWTPSAAGSFPVTIRAANAGGTADQPYTISVPAPNGKIVYSISGDNTPRMRDYADSTSAFGAAGATFLGTPAIQTVLRASPTKNELIAGYVNASGVLQVMCYNGTAWSNEWSVTVGGTGTTRRFDIAYESNSGDVLVLYSTNTATTNELAYRTKAGNTGCGTANWPAATNLDAVRTSGVVQWVKLAWDRRASSNLMTAVWADANSDLSARVWSGSAWGSEPTAALETSLQVVTAAQDVENFDVEYESLSGDVMVVWGNSAGADGTNGVRYATCTGGTAACTWSAVTTPPTFLDDATHIDLSANPNTDEMVFASIGKAGGDLQIGYWSGSAWTNTANVDTTATAPTAGAKFVSTGWLINGSTTRSIVVYYDATATNIGWYVGNAGVFTAQTDFTTAPVFGAQKQYDIQMDPFNKDRLMLIVSDANSDIFAKRLVMSSTGTFTWTNADGSAALEANTASNTYKTSAFAYTRSFADTQAPTAPVSLTATAVSPTQIDLSWPASTDNVGVTGYKVERCQGTSCTNFAQIATPAASPFSDTGLTAGTTYRY